MSSNSRPHKLKCTGCGQCFSSRNALTKHIKYSTGKCTQLSTVINCPHCGRVFSNQKGLDHHIRMNQYCSVLSDPQKMSLIPFPSPRRPTEPVDGNASLLSHTTFEIDEYSAQWTVKKRKAEQTKQSTSPLETNVWDKSTMLTSKRDNSSCAKRNNQHYSMKEIRSMFHSTRQKSSPNDLVSPVLESLSKHPDLRVSFNAKFILSDPTLKLPINDIYLMNILLHRTKFSSPTVCSTISVLFTDLMNNHALSLMDSSCDSIDGYNSSTHQISRSDVGDFILRYAIFWVPSSIELLNEDERAQCDHAEAEAEIQLVTLEDYVDLRLESSSVTDNDNEAEFVLDDDEVQVPLQNDVFNLVGADEPDEEIDEAVDRVMLSFQDQIDHTRLHSVYNDNDIANLELYEMLTSSGAPAYLFDDIQSWAYKHSSKLFLSNSPRLQRRNKFVRNMASKVYGNVFADQMKPSVKVLKLPSQNTIEVVVCSFKAQLVSLLTDRRLMKPENLLLDERNPFAEVPDGILSELNTGWWYKETRDEICTNPNKHVLLPIIIFLDASNIDKNGRLQVNPMTFTLGIFKRAIRNKAEAWRTMGYVDDQLKYLDEDVRKTLDKSTKAQDVHAIISLIMDEFKQIQGSDGGFSWKLDLGHNTFDVVFKLAIQTIIGDCKGNDLLCGRFGSHGINVKRLCRDCNVLTLHGDNCDHICQYLTRDDIENRTKDELRDLSFHCIRNAFSDVYFGARNIGITEVTPPEPLHGFRLGICKYLFEGFEKQCPKETMRLINYGAMNISKCSCRSSVRDLPDLQSFRTKGVTKCNTLSGDEQYARVFCLYLTILIPEVLQSLSTADRFECQTFVRDDGSEFTKNVNIGPMGFGKANDWLTLISLTLTMNSWIMSPEHAKHDLELRTLRNVNERTLAREPRAMKKVRLFMRLYKDVINRTAGNGLKIPKFHQLLHYVDQILKDGSLLNIDGGRCESIATTNYTNPGRRTQMRQQSYMKQLAYAHYSDVVVHSAIHNSRIPYMKLTEECDDIMNENNETTKLCGSRFLLCLDRPGNEINEQSVLQFIWQGKKPKNGYSKSLTTAISKRLWMNRGAMNSITHHSKVNGFTECNKCGTVYRAHPCYRDDGQWFDWGLIEWDEGDNPVPAKILMFLDLTNCEFNHIHDDQEAGDNNRNVDEDAEANDIRAHPDILYLKKERYVIIQTALEPFEDNIPNTRYRVENMIAQRLRMEQSWRIVPLDALVAPAFVIPETMNKDDVSVVDHVLIREKKQWSDLFLQFDH